MNKTALITGATGQDAAYLAELLLGKNYKVYLTDRQVSSDKDRYWRLDELNIRDKVELLPASLGSLESLTVALGKSNPTEIYHLAANSFVSSSFEDEFSVFDTNIYGTQRLFHAIREVAPKSRVYFAGSSEQYGRVEDTPQTERTRFHPRSPYGISKTAGYYIAMHHREKYGQFVSNGILFNHESPLRGRQFVTRKIVHGILESIVSNNKLHLGNLDATRDWGFAKDYVEAMWLMLQHNEPDDFIVATGTTHSVREFLCASIKEINRQLNKNYQVEDLVLVDPSLFRPTEVDLLLGDPFKAKWKLGWESNTTFESLVEKMVSAELARFGLKP